MNHNKHLIFPIVLTLLLLLLISCGGVEETRFADCVNQANIYSTEDLQFYAVKDNSRNKSYASLDIPDDEFYLCFNDKKSNIMDQCADYDYLGFNAKKLTAGTRISFDGYVVKTVKWGIVTIDSGPSPTTWLRAKLDSGDIIWVSGHELMLFFERKQEITPINKKAYMQLRIEKRIPSPIQYDSQNRSTEESMKKNYQEQSRIEDWDCTIK